ncbi:MAG: ATP-binding protein [Rhodospirillaceae bacterium]
MINAEIDRETKDAAILIVDDNASNVDLLREILRHQGYGRIRGETDPRLVPDICRTESWDILLLDIRMPHLSGFQLIELLRPIFADDYVPILVLTAQTDQETRRKSLEVGASDFLTKPFVAWELVQRVRNMLQIRTLYKRTKQQNKELERRVEERTLELSDALAATRKADRAKMDFLSVMSHELRTPLNAIIGFSEVISAQDMRPPIPPDYLDYVKLIEESGKHLLDMVNRILEYTKGATGTVTIEDGPIDLRELIERCIAMLTPKAMGKRVSMLLEDSPSLLVRADERRMRELMLSILDNAIKFNHDGGTATASLVCCDADIVITVTDNGPGISPEIQARIFDPFTQGDGALDRRYEGIGIGLPIVQRYAELHGGRVELDSEPGHGTIVRVRLPIERLISQPQISGTHAVVGQ